MQKKKNDQQDVDDVKKMREKWKWQEKVCNLLLQKRKLKMTRESEKQTTWESEKTIPWESKSENYKRKWMWKWQKKMNTLPFEKVKVKMTKNEQPAIWERQQVWYCQSRQPQRQRREASSLHHMWILRAEF